MTKQTFIKGALILIVAGMISRLLGFVNRIVLARLLGDEGVGVYMLALPALFLMITLSQIGIPIAVSKLVAEASIQKDTQRIKKILFISFSITISLSVILTLAFIALAPIVSNHLLLDERTYIPMLMISPIIPIVAISAVIRGYFQGKQNMKPQAAAQVIEQVVRISLVFIFIQIMLPFGISYAAGGAMFAVVIGELASLGYMYYCFKTDWQRPVSIFTKFSFPQLRQSVSDIMKIAIPTAGTRLIGSVTYFLEPILVSQSLFIAGYTVSQSTSAYGQLTGYVLPLLLLPTFITHSLSVALIPSVSEFNALNHQGSVHYRIRQALRLSYASGGLVTIVFMLYAQPLLSIVYGNVDGTTFLSFMAPFFLLLYFQGPLQAALQALNYAKQAMINSLIGSVVKLSALWLLATKPSFGINGVVIAIIVGVVVVTTLHFITLYKTIGFKIPVGLLFKMVGLLAGLYYIGSKLQETWGASPNIIYLALAIMILCIAYFIGLVILRIVSKEEWQQLSKSRR
ncbi:stage V sporulation protein B [Tenuibacillus multivorans]|uniref:Stage V sporulation protein B n=1 Tax=Tenuibacillus multivorans TaxID=237069 RepID=A0A1G9ZJ48_9BACI|nr:stage V sporulation protein B [Tenuibacillus multivorans]GEL77479.1 stage V sporulation protein B [Tenuibacillus multivorans]SDN21330.1 stage V sporulation protein B [Tenuibacillus multivorans]